MGKCWEIKGKYGASVPQVWASAGKLWESVGQVSRKYGQVLGNYGKVWGKCPASMGKWGEIMGKRGGSVPQVWASAGKLSESVGQVSRKSVEDFLAETAFSMIFGLYPKKRHTSQIVCRYLLTSDSLWTFRTSEKTFGRRFPCWNRIIYNF
jgi:hypothetical protein